MTHLFNDHPASVGETYVTHMGMALGFAATLALAALVCLIHALLPFAFEKTGSRLIQQLHTRMVTHRATPAHRPAHVSMIESVSEAQQAR